MENPKVEYTTEEKLNILINAALDANIQLNNIYELCTKTGKEKAKAVAKHVNQAKELQKKLHAAALDSN